MNKLKRGAVLSVILVFVFTLQVFAATFPDVTQTNYSWAYEYVESMAKDGIIKGYEDNTFRPANVVTKLEALVLISRILGVNDEINTAILDSAKTAFSDDVSEYNVAYGENEIAFLLTKNIITPDELDDYIGGTNAKTGLKRYEVAILLTKAMGDEDSVKENMVSVLDYADASDIPAYAKKYVEYVTEKGLMQGMEENTFQPNGEVTRAQMAVVLYKLRDLAKFESTAAIVSAVNKNAKTITFKTSDGSTFSYTVNNSVKMRFDGSEIAVSDVKTASEAVVTLRDGDLFSIDLTTALVDEDVVGAISSIVGTSKISIYEVSKYGKEDEKTEYPISDNVVVTYDGESSSISKLSTGDYVEMSIKAGEVVSINAKDKDQTVKGTIKEIALTPSLYIVLEKNNGTTEDYYIDSNVVVVKNGNKKDLSDVLAGDRVTLDLEYGVIVEIEATSSSTKKTGIIEEIIISNSPKLKLKMNGQVSQYSLARDAVITVTGQSATIYDLRLGSGIDVTIESDTITKISTQTTGETTQITGTIDLVNVSYGLIQVSYYDSLSGQNVTQQVFVKSSSKIYDSVNGKDVSLKNLKAGTKVSVIGALSTGIFEATTVIVMQ